MSPSRESARVRVLPEALANQIAAGEVVERPASVVKELVENAIDAGASRVLIDLEEAGRGLVRVVDDGSGMAHEDAELAVLRHATSKVCTAEDLEAIGTLGFRGEALPSIASVSRFTLVTRRGEDEAATVVKIEGGGAPVITRGAAPVGTRIEVRDLFWNVPARLKFLKTDATETQHVVELVKGFALGYPHVHFRLGTGARTALDLPVVRKLGERVAQVLGAAGKHLYEVIAAEDDGAGRQIRVVGFVSNAREAKATQGAMTMFVNGRRVKDRTVAHAVVSAFGSDLAAGRFPQAVLWVHLDPAEVDVNVHPTKAEVRFRRPQVVHDAVTRAVQRMLVRRPWLVDAPLPLERFVPEQRGPAAQHRFVAPELPGVREPGASSREPGASSREPGASSREPGASSREPGVPSREPSARPPHRTELRFMAEPTPVARFAAEPLRGASEPPRGAREPLGTKLEPMRGALHGLRERTPASEPARWRMLGRKDALVVLEGEAGLALVDAAVALAALTFDALVALERPVMAQPLLLPARLDLAPHEVQRLTPRLEALAALGIHIAPFGGATHQLLGLPLPALAASPTTALAELAACAARGGDDEAMMRVLARVTATTQLARGLDERTLTALVDFAPRAIADRRGAFVLARDEIVRRTPGRE